VCSQLVAKKGSQNSVSTATQRTARGPVHSTQTDTRPAQTQHREERTMSACSQPVDERSKMPVEELSRGVSQKGGQLRMNPFRNGRPPEGDTEHLIILLDTVVHGKLPEDYQPVGAPPRDIIKKPGDIPDTWVAQSHFFPDVGYRVFFEIKGPYKRRGGTLLTVFYG
jgi:hypothetical protein